MAEASLAAQRLAVSSMRMRTALTDLVPAANIFDRHMRPTAFPCVIVGEGTTVGDDTDCHDLSTVSLDFHIWTTESGFEACKNIAGEVRRALRNVEGMQDGFHCTFNFENTVYLRDPDGLHSHGVASFEVLAEDTVGIT